MLQNGLQFAGIHMEKHHFLKAVAGDAVIFGKYKQVIDAGVMGGQKILLQAEAGSCPGWWSDRWIQIGFF